MSRILLAFAPADITKAVADNDIEPITPNTPSREDLRGILDDVRSAGIAVSEGELIPGSVTVAVPIVRRDGIVGALAVTGPETRCGIAWRSSVRKLLPDAAATLVAALEEV